LLLRKNLSQMWISSSQTKCRWMTALIISTKMNFSITLICLFSSKTTFFSYFMKTISFIVNSNILVVFALINVSMTIVMLRSSWKIKMLILIECIKISKIFNCILISISYNLIHWECWQKNITFFFCERRIWCSRCENVEKWKLDSSTNCLKNSRILVIVTRSSCDRSSYSSSRRFEWMFCFSNVS
jgi:hypothetical protein